MKQDFGSLCLTLRLEDSVTIGDTLVKIVQLKNKEIRLVIRARRDVKIGRVPAPKNISDKCHSSK